MRDILFIKTSSLGDVIHHMPAVTETRRRVAGARISWVVEEAFAPLVRLHPAVDAVIAVASRRWRSALAQGATWRDARRFARDLRRQTYDDVIDAQGLLRTGLMARLARGRRHGHDPESVRERAASWFYDVQHRIDRDQHAIARNRLLTGRALGYVPEGPVDFGLDRGRLRPAATDPYGVLLHATARPEKEWPIEQWIALGTTLARDYDLVLPWGNAAERLRSEAIAAGVARARVPQLRPLDDLARLIAGASFVVGVDTGLLHLGAALGVPLVGIYVGTKPALHGPQGAGPIEVLVSPTAADVAAALARVT
jgi:lipopolysaccharide heptosyltransferase I